MSQDSDLGLLQNEITGEVIEPSDHRYDPAKKSFYRGYDRRRPLAVVRVARSSDVAATVRFARDSGVGLAVRAGGHSVLGHSSIDGGVVIDLSGLEDVDIDVDGRTAWAGGGVLAGEYLDKTSEHGLVTGFGDTPTVGIAGITLGGGVGFLHRKLGLTIDSLLGAEIVTADGEVRLIDEKNDPDLFWAIRGGGGNFGVVTRLHYRLHPVDTVVGGMIILPATPKVITDFVAIAREASDDLSVIAGVAVAPPMPMIPEVAHGKPIVMGFVVHAGDVETGQEEVSQFRSLAEPLADDISVMPYTAMFAEEEGPPPVDAMSIRSVFSDDLTLEDAEALVEALPMSTAAMSVTQIRVLGGEVARVLSEETAFAHRHREMIVNVAAAYENSDERADHEAWVTNLSERLRKGTAGAYVNFAGDDSEGCVREIYPGATWDRLVEVKTKYDPDNLFKSNHNIPPAT
jgi:FAD/FMN-containing dehydrogenase